MFALSLSVHLPPSLPHFSHPPTLIPSPPPSTHLPRSLPHLPPPTYHDPLPTSLHPPTTYLLFPPPPSPLSLSPSPLPPPLLSAFLPPAALAEAHDISMHLKPLRRHFEEMEDCDYLELPRQFPAMFHCICLVWSHSTHYQQPSRIVVLLQEVTNLLIQLVMVLELLRLHYENTDQ